MGQLIRQIKKKNGLIRRFAEEEDAVGVVEIILILVVKHTPLFLVCIACIERKKYKKMWKNVTENTVKGGNVYAV